jgi:hypothetical protein
MMKAEELIKERYPFYDPHIAQKDIEINGEQVEQLMNDFASLRVAEANTWVKLEDRLPEPKQRVDLWLVPDDEEKSHRITWTWEKEHTSNLRINASKATHWTPLQTPPTE